MKTRIWSIPQALLLAFTACRGPGPADPMAVDENITWEPDDSTWHVWTSPAWGCGNATREALSAGTIRLR